MLLSSDGISQTHVLSHCPKIFLFRNPVTYLWGQPISTKTLQMCLFFFFCGYAQSLKPHCCCNHISTSDCMVMIYMNWLHKCNLLSLILTLSRVYMTLCSLNAWISTPSFCSWHLNEVIFKEICPKNKNQSGFSHSKSFQTLMTFFFLGTQKDNFFPCIYNGSGLAI